jgi:hypothetical protein
MIVVIGLPAYGSSAVGEGTAGGLAVDVAAAASAGGSKVELVGKVGDDGAGDAVVLALGRLGVGHAALLRDPARPTPVLSTVVVTAGGVAGAGDGDAAEAGARADAAEPLDAAGAEVLAGADAENPVPDVELLPADPAERPGLEAADIALGLRYLAEMRVVVVAVPLPELAVAAVVEGATFAGARIVVLLAPGATPPSLPPDATLLEAPAVDDGSFGRVVGAFAAGLDNGTEPAAAFSAAVRASGWEAVAD